MISPMPPAILPSDLAQSLNATMRVAAAQENQRGVADGATVSEHPQGVSFQMDWQGFGQDAFEVAVVDKGPEGQADFTDARYWGVNLAYLAASPNSELSKLTLYPAPQVYRRYVVFSHLPEIQGRSHTLSTTHINTTSGEFVSPPTLVRVRAVPQIIKDTGNPADKPRWCLIGQVISRDLFPVLVSPNGGANGDGSSYASWTYDLYTLHDPDYTFKLNGDTPVAPKCSPARILKGPVTKASTGTVGLAYLDKEGKVQLYSVMEVHGEGPCTTTG